MKTRLLICVVLALTGQLLAQDKPPGFRALAIAERGGVHGPYVEAAKAYLNQLASENSFVVDYIEDTAKIDDDFLARYHVFVQLNYPPYAWTPKAAAAFEKYIDTGKGGWVGFHHATLLGEFDGHKMWNWFHDFMGQIRWKDYLPKFASGTVNVEAPDHPLMKGIDKSFFIKLEEWYTYDKSPRPNVKVICSVDENTYQPDTKIKMGDHPVVWVNEKKAARNVYIFMGHSPVLFESDAYRTLFKNAVLWAAKKD